MSGGLAPSKSTVYIGNLPFSLTNNDLHKVFEKFGKVVKVTILKDKDSHRSRGVAFVLFLDRDGAQNCVQELDNTQMFGRTLKCKIAKDNGRATEFIKRKYYTDKSRCYECGEFGHLSYNCPHNMLGDREPPPKKKKKKSKAGCDDHKPEEEEDEEDESEGEDPAVDSLAAAIRIQQEKIIEDQCKYQMAPPENLDGAGSSTSTKIKKYKKDSYFSDEEELDET